MDLDRRILGLSVLLAAGLWTIDAVIDHRYFYEAPFLDLLVLRVPPHELFIRTTLALLALGFGLTGAWLVGNLQSRESDLRLFRSLIDEANDSVFVIDPESGQIIDVNDTATEMLGYSREQLLRMSVSDISSVAEDREGFTEFLESRAGRVIENEQFVHERADGTHFPVEVSADTVTIEGTQYRIAIVRDVTDRLEYERELETLMSNLPGIVYRCENDPAWPMELVRGQCEELVGYPASAIQSGAVSWGEDVIHPADRETVADEVAAAVEADEPFELTYRIRTADDETRWVWERGRKVRLVHSEADLLEGFITDITDRKRLQEDLQASKERYESLFRSIRDAILVADTDRRISNCNPAFTDLFGYDLDEIEGEPTEILYQDPTEYQQMGTAIDAHMDDPQFTFTIDYEKKSGQVFPGETNVFYLEDADGETVGFIGVIRDVSEREDRFQHLKTIDRILQHNFSNEMNVIQGNAERASRVGSPAVEEHTDRIIATGDDLLGTVRKEREITKFLTDPPAEDEIDLAATIRKTVDRVHEEYPDADIEVHCDGSSVVRANLAIGRAIEELVTNSIVHGASGTDGVTVTVIPNDETVTIRVIDENARIPEMERYVLTGEQELTPLYHGSGLGLWLVRLIVHQSDGFLAFEDNEPVGNIVHIHLPRA